MEDEKKTYQYLTFFLADEMYGIDVLKIREVLEIPHVTRIPRCLPFMAGVINLRGSIVPLVDLRRKFNLPSTEISVHSSIIIVEVSYDEEIIMIGVLVDSVRKVIKISSAALEAPPRVGIPIDSKFIEKLGKIGSQLVIILNSENLFSKTELTSISATGDSAGPVVSPAEHGEEDNL